MKNEREINGFRVIDHGYIQDIDDWKIPGVICPFCRLYYTPICGSSCHIGSKASHAFTPDCFYIIPCNQPVYASSTVPAEQFFVHFFIYEHMSGFETDILKIPVAPELLQWIEEYRNIRQIDERYMSRNLIAEHILSGVLLRLPHKLLQADRELSPQIAKVCAFINKNPGRPIPNPELAKISGFACNSFIRIFAREVGMSPQAYVRKKRIETVCVMLQTTPLSIDVIAQRTGFVDRFHMTKVFKQQLQFTPSLYRKLFGNPFPIEK